MGIVHIAIIGAGQLGSRHLQAMALLDRPAIIHVMDPSPDSLRIAEERFNQVKRSDSAAKVDFFQEMSALSDYYDIVIIATTSKIRRKVIEQLLVHTVVQHLILEKIVFQLPQDFIDMDHLFREKNIQVSVNCPRRMLTSYQMIREALKDEVNIQFQVTGSNWDLGTNGIHMLDLFAYICGNAEISITTSQLSNSIMESKRKGFYNFDGTLLGSAGKGASFSITSYAEGEAPIHISISTSRHYYVIREEAGYSVVKMSSKEQHWSWQEEKFPLLLQSHQTHLYIQHILDTGYSGLTAFAESWKLHLPLLDVLSKHYNKLTESESDLCPIT